MESCIRISLSEYIDPDQSQRFDHSGRNEIWREPFPPARTCDTRGPHLARPGWGSFKLVDRAAGGGFDRLLVTVHLRLCQCRASR